MFFESDDGADCGHGTELFQYDTRDAEYQVNIVNALI